MHTVQILAALAVLFALLGFITSCVDRLSLQVTTLLLAVAIVLLALAFVL